MWRGGQVTQPNSRETGQVVLDSGTLTPVAATERLEVVDVLRGFALLGILVINIQSFALTQYSDINPANAGDFTGINRAAWLISYVTCQSKMIMLFSMLFGGGLVLMASRARERGKPLLGLYYRRLMWLGIFGVLHAYLLWEGDILFGYAICGLLLYPLRRLSTKLLLILGLILYLSQPLALVGVGFGAEWLRDTAAAAVQAGDQATSLQETIRDVWREVENELTATPERLADEAAIVRGSYGRLFLERARFAFGIQLAMIFLLAWGILGVMLWGVCLMRLGVLSGERSPRFYVLLALLGYGCGFPVVGFGAYDMLVHEFDLVRLLKFSSHFNEVGRVFVTLGHIGLIVTIHKSGLLRHLTFCLAAAGRMALTNYLMQSLLCAVLFHGWGFGLFGQLSRMALLGVVAAICLLQLVISPVWLKYFRFGPAEWLWRSLTYWQQQPMRRPPTASPFLRRA
jgi:uncharacterized protein